MNVNNNWKNCVNQNSSVENISNVYNYIKPYEIGIESPIDSFYSNLKEIITVGTPDFLNTHSFIGSLFFVGCISATENYFREIFSQVLIMCPISKSKAASQSINLGTVIWHNGIQVERGAFENYSFASSETIIKTCNSHISFNISDNQNLTNVLKEYSRLCEIRHSIVHSNSFLSGKNAIKLGLISSEDPLKISINYNELQECAAICTALVASFNTELFHNLINRWAVGWRKNEYSIAGNEDKLFKSIWTLMYSKIDGDASQIENGLTWIKCRNKVKRAFHL